MKSLIPGPDQAMVSTAREMAYELGLRDATRILADLAPSPVQPAPRVAAAPNRRPAGTKRPGTRTRRGQRSVAMASRIAARRTRRTGSPHVVVALPGGRYGVCKVRQAR